MSILSDPLDLRTERAEAKHFEIAAELRAMRAELARLLVNAAFAGSYDPPLVGVEALHTFGRLPRIAALHEFAAQRRLVRFMRPILGLLRDESAARAPATWLFAATGLRE